MYLFTDYLINRISKILILYINFSSINLKIKLLSKTIEIGFHQSIDIKLRYSCLLIFINI